MSDLKFADSHNLVAFLSKPAKSEGFEQIVDFLNATPIKYALTINPTIYNSCINKFWDTIKVKMVNEEVQLHALVDRKKVIITESTIRRDLQLEDAEATILQIFSASLHISNIDYMYIKSYGFRLFSSLPVSHLLWSSQSFGHQKAINGFDMPLPVAVCSGLVNPLAPRKANNGFEKSLPRAVCSWTSQTLCLLDMVD
ncbi:hypothetical protein Tco_0733292 [Tanacetum coccineum]